MKRQDTLIQEFIDGATEGEASHMYIDGDVMYSYGSHFPLLVRRDWGFILNADKYSSTTSQHQSQCFKHATVQLPFSSLRSAGVDYRQFNLIDHEAQRWDTIGYRKANTDTVISKAQYEVLDAEQQNGFYPVEERRPESAIIEQNGKHYLSSMDNQNYFLCLLPEPVRVIAKAFSSLKPKEVKDDNFIRQGEWFFVEATDLPLIKDTVEASLKARYHGMTPKFILPTRTSGGNLHIATRGTTIGDSIFVSGQIRHQTRWGGRGDHRMLRLSTLDSIKIYRAFENRALGSWSASGRVD